MYQGSLFDDEANHVYPAASEVQQYGGRALPSLEGGTTNVSAREGAASEELRPEDTDGDGQDEVEGQSGRPQPTGNEVPFSGKRTKKARTEASGIELILKYHEQKAHCALSGLPISIDEMACDHIVARELGGADTIDNLQWVHRDINNMKGTIEQERFIKLCRLVASQATTVPDMEW